MKKFDNELSEVHRHLAEMAELAQRMVSMVAECVCDRTAKRREEIDQAESRLDQLQVQVDGEAVRLLTVYGPVATDLRMILVMTHITSQLERMGDQVINVCEALDLMRSDPSHHTLPELHKMARLVCEMVEDAIASYFDKDADKAATTRTHDDLVDAMDAQIMKKLLSEELLKEVLNGTEDIADALAQILIARHLERIADQAVNVCKEVIYMVQGDDVRHSRGEPSE